MKRLLYLFCCIILGALISAGAYAQTNGSRLNIAGKSKPTRLEANKPLNSFSPYKVNNQPLILEKSKALSTYYRTLLFGNGPEPSLAEDKKEVEVNTAPSRPVDTPGTVSFESGNSQENENFYVSDRIVVKNLYPNPANDFAFLRYTLNGDVKDAKISLYNVLGATVREYTLNRQSQQLTMDTRQLPNGVYFYQLTVDGQKVATKKLLIRHHQ